MSAILLLGVAGTVEAQGVVAPGAPAATPAPASGPAVATPSFGARQPLSASDVANLKIALTSRSVSEIRNARDAIADPLARKTATYAYVDAAAESLGFFELEQAKRDLAGWPRAARRQSASEKLLAGGGQSPSAVVAWFGGQPPTTAEGAMTLASALRSLGKTTEATELIRHTFRNVVFEADAQSSMSARFPEMLRPEDFVRRADLLLYGTQGPAARAIVEMLPIEAQPAARARIAMRANMADAQAQYDALTPTDQMSPGVAFERAAFLRRRDDAASALQLVRYFGPPPAEEVSSRIWAERKALVGAALRSGNYQAAYAASSNAGMPIGPDAAEAEFYAGWLALTRLNNPKAAERHFANIAVVGSSPITVSRALYWQGRAAEALGDPVQAAVYYGEGSRHITTFYGQLAAEKAGVKAISLGKDPQPTAADRARFEDRELVKVARMLIESGLKDQFRNFVLFIDDTLPNAEEAALLVDLARAYNDPDLGMRAVRTAAQRGFILPERGYPILPYIDAPGGAEHAYTLSITRQESNFDPMARSSVGARGMMQLMPTTAQLVARKLGDPYSIDRLAEPSYNMRLGSAYLGQMIDRFRGSYVMASAAYNAGPGRPAQWVNQCGDPRTAGVDALDFIECIPFSETRNYVMRTIETMMVYRARLNGGQAPLALSAELERGGYGNYAVVGPTSSATQE